MIAYKMADIGFGFEMSVSAESDYFGTFRIDEKEFDGLKDKHLFTVSDACASIPESGRKISDSGDYEAYQVKDGFLKITERFDGGKYSCLCFRRSGLSGGEISFTENGIEAERTSAELFRIIDFFSSLLFYDALILHGAVVELNGKAYIFSGRSGIGKSTQAELWKKFNGARILNGDRVILRRVNGEWLAFGTPMCGSSDICEQFSLCIGAIAFLEQGKNNSVEIPDMFDKLMLLFSQINCVQSDDDTRSVFTELTGNLATEIRILKYRCTAEKEAAEALRKYLKL